MKNLIILFVLPQLVFSQSEISFTMWIGFTDKGNIYNNSYNASDLFSERAIQRREKQNISIDFTDYPLNSDYLNEIRQMDVQILKQSKWFNGIIVSSKDSTLLKKLLLLPFVNNVDTLAAEITSDTNRRSSKFEAILVNDNTYGKANNQIEMIGGISLHEQGFMGQGIHIAVLDAGFGNTNELGAFSHLYSNNQLLGTWDFVDQEPVVYESSSHGMSVLSTMAGLIEGEYIGTAPEASYWLLKTEDPNSETLIEEYNWAIAAEFADSVGVDIINSSLGYTTFDIPSQNHTYADMDGQTTIITKAATLAARKGMIVCNSAGNSGNKSWKYIGAPADADSILTVGGVDAEQEVSVFSSFGPSADGRVKPNVSAQASATAIINRYNNVSYSNGTSFSSPIVAGMTACLWQAHYEKTNMQLIDAIIRSAHLYQNPDNQLGYGIPNFSLANALLLDVEDINKPTLEVYPNPANAESTIYIYSANASAVSYKILDLSGKVVDMGEVKWNFSRFAINLTSLQSGMYIVEVKAGDIVLVEKLSVVD